MTSEAVSAAIKAHQMSVPDWQYAALVKELHRWIAIFDREFGLNLPAYPVIHFAKQRNSYATFAWFRTEIGTRDNIEFNVNELHRPVAETLMTLCHELIHLWQHYHGDPPKGNYHNTAFREKARACGLAVDARGCHSGPPTEVMTNLLDRYGVSADVRGNEPRLFAVTKSPVKMLKWRCHCTTVRCATQLTATCMTCQQPFAKGQERRG